MLLSKIANLAYEKSLTGFEFASGIPGTIGGAIRMNAGAYGGEIKDVLVSTTYIDKNLEIHTINNQENEFGYRESRFIKNNKDIIISAVLQFVNGNKEKIKTQMDSNANARKEKQPINFPNAGSTFKRGEGFITAKLIDECGLKGYKIGGAIKMNAGAYGGEMKDIVNEVTYLDYDGNTHTINNSECEFSYRHSKFFDEKAIILQAKLNLEKGNKSEIENKVKDLLEQRKEKQPLEYPNAGSTFKRVEGFITAKLIDDCGLKGYSVGGAQVSENHAGFIVNKNNATASDILELIEYVQKKVKEKTEEDIKLEIEVIGG